MHQFRFFFFKCTHILDFYFKKDIILLFSLVFYSLIYSCFSLVMINIDQLRRDIRLYGLYPFFYFSSFFFIIKKYFDQLITFYDPN